MVASAYCTVQKRAG